MLLVLGLAAWIRGGWRHSSADAAARQRRGPSLLREKVDVNATQPDGTTPSLGRAERDADSRPHSRRRQVSVTTRWRDAAVLACATGTLR